MEIARVLIVEDKEEVQARYKGYLPELEIVSALTIPDALQAFEDNPNFDAIVMDACVPGDTPNTISLVMHFRDTYEGPMIAASSEESYRIRLMKAGCDHESNKDDLPQNLLQVLSDKRRLPRFK